MNSILGTPEEWQKLGFRSGLEIHHQIFTEKKLFCRCPAGHYSETYHAEVVRHMRPTLSELGEYDGTALMEFKTKKEIIYRLNRDTVCTYEMDDNPPFPINQEAVDIALTVALAFRCKMVGELHVIRKQYLDGSIPTGFQRTCIIGVDGILPLSNGKEVRVIQVGLEEDACREFSDIGHRVVFIADRLGMPLIEVVTEKDLLTPWEVADAADRIGRLLRATGMVRRGIGAGRQDVNVSVEGSTRVEIKGVPRIPRIPYLTAHEARRQRALLDLRDEMTRRNLNDASVKADTVLWEDKFSFERPELAAAVAGHDSIRIVCLPLSKGLVCWPLAGNHTFADELSGRVRVIACLDSVPNLLHSDGDSGGLNERDMRRIREAAGCGPDDVAVVTWGPDADTLTAAGEIIARWDEAKRGVPNETRQALRDNTTTFERVLPGPDRMYPDTDSAPFAVTSERIEAARVHVPEAPWDREKRFRKLGLPEDVIRRLAIHPIVDRFEAITQTHPEFVMFIAETLTRLPVALHRKGVEVFTWTDPRWDQILQGITSRAIKREVLFDLMKSWVGLSELSLDAILNSHGWQPVSETEADGVVEEACKIARQESSRPETASALAMRHAMESLAGRVEGRTVAARVEALLT